MPSYTGSAASALGEEYVQRSMTDLTEQTSYNATRVCAKYFGQEVWSEIAGLIARQVSDDDYVTQWTCGSGDAVGDPVRISAASTVTKALATTEANSRVIGVIRHKGTLGAANAPTATTCYLAHYYVATGLSGGTPGSPVYLTNSGGYSASAGTYLRQVGVFVSSTVGMICVDSKASLAFGTSAGTACEGNDSRLSNARTPVGTALTQNKIWVGNGSNLAAEADLPISGNVNLALNPGFETVLPGTHTTAITRITTGAKNSCLPGWMFTADDGCTQFDLSQSTSEFNGASGASASVYLNAPLGPCRVIQEWGADRQYLASFAKQVRTKYLTLAVDVRFDETASERTSVARPIIYCLGTGGGSTVGSWAAASYAWQRLIVSALVPADCTYINFGVELNPTTSTKLYIDNVMVVAAPYALTSLPFTPRLPVSISTPIDGTYSLVYTTPADTNYHTTGDGTADTDYDVNGSRPAWATKSYILLQSSGAASAGNYAAMRPAGDTNFYAISAQQAGGVYTIDGCELPIGKDGQWEYTVDDTDIDMHVYIKRWVGEAL